MPGEYKTRRDILNGVRAVAITSTGLRFVPLAADAVQCETRLSLRVLTEGIISLPKMVLSLRMVV